MPLLSLVDSALHDHAIPSPLTLLHALDTVDAEVEHHTRQNTRAQ